MSATTALESSTGERWLAGLVESVEWSGYKRCGNHGPLDTPITRSPFRTSCCLSRSLRSTGFGISIDHTGTNSAAVSFHVTMLLSTVCTLLLGSAMTLGAPAPASDRAITTVRHTPTLGSLPLVGGVPFCLSIADFEVLPGAPVNFTACADPANVTFSRYQLFELPFVNSDTKTSATVGPITTTADDGATLCVTADFSGTPDLDSDGVPLVAWPCDGGPYQTWKVQDGTVRLAGQVFGNDKCIEIGQGVIGDDDAEPFEEFAATPVENRQGGLLGGLLGSLSGAQREWSN